jgi:hypothetical protein
MRDAAKIPERLQGKAFRGLRLPGTGAAPPKIRPLAPVPPFP